MGIINPNISPKDFEICRILEEGSALRVIMLCWLSHQAFLLGES